MPRGQKLDVKITFKVTAEDKEHLEEDMATLAAEVERRTGMETNLSEFLRLVLHDLHTQLAGCKPIVWPPRLEVLPRKPRPKGK